MGFGSSLVADGEAAELGDSSQRPLDDPPVSPHSLAALYAAAGDPVLDAAAGQSPTTAKVVVGLVGVQLRKPFARPSPALADWLDSIEERLQHPAVVLVGDRQLRREGDALGIGEAVSFVPGLPRSVGFGSVAEPPSCSDRGAVEGGATEVDAVLASEPVEQPLLQAVPHPGRLPVA